jgi:hypothetical protein
MPFLSELIPVHERWFSLITWHIKAAQPEKLDNHESF